MYWTPYFLLLVLTTFPQETTVPAQTSADIFRDIIQKEKSRVRQSQFLSTSTDGGPQNASGTSFVQEATAARGWSLTVGSSGQLDRYDFPLTLEVNAFQLAGVRASSWGIKRSLERSNFTVNWTPLVLTREGEGAARETEAEASKTVGLSFKVPFLGQRDVDDLDKELEPDANRVFNRLLKQYDLDDESQRQALANRLAEELRPTLNDVEAGLAKQLQASFKVDYRWDTRQGKADRVTTLLAVTKGGLGRRKQGKPVSRPLQLSGNLWATWFRQEKPLSLWAGSAGGTLPIIQDVTFSLQGSFEHYSGAGFRGVAGVRDTAYRTDVSLAQIFAFSIPGRDKLTLTIKQTHLGSGSTDIVVAIAFGVRVDPR